MLCASPELARGVFPKQAAIATDDGALREPTGAENTGQVTRNTTSMLPA